MASNQKLLKYSVRTAAVTLLLSKCDFILSLNTNVIVSSANCFPMESFKHPDYPELKDDLPPKTIM